MSLFCLLYTLFINSRANIEFEHRDLGNLSYEEIR